MRRVLFCLAIGLVVFLSVSGVQAADSMTRAEAAELIHNHAGAQGAVYEPVFLDVPICHPQAAAVAWLAEAGITQGTGGSLFSPSREITLGEFHRLLARYAHYCGLPYDAPPWSDERVTTHAGESLLLQLFL